MIRSQRLTVGIMAPVDAGKTTLSEAVLYNGGTIRALGRVDHKDAFLDTYDLEKKRGITIFAKQAEFSVGNREFTLLDTPGHMDFSAETERTLQVLDIAVLLVSAADGITAYTKTLWKILKKHMLPTFIFVNKMDSSGADGEKIYESIRETFGSECVDLGRCDEEDIVICDEKLLENHLAGEKITDGDLRNLVRRRRIFPVFFGSALKNENIMPLMEAFERYTENIAYPDEFGARVYKISRDAQGTRLTHMKITGGTISPKDIIEDTGEKIDRIRVYNGSGFTEPKKVQAGDICAVAGLNETFCGQSLGCDDSTFIAEMEPVLSYRIIFPDGTDVHDMYVKLKQLEEEEPQLRIEWDEEKSCINVRLMGEVQTEVLKTMFKERHGIDIEFGQGSIVYLETVKRTSEGVGHYEPLRHYSEVHLLLEPLERGAGLVFESAADNDVLKPHWQALILSHLAEKRHRGVLTGSYITDMKITVLTGKDHVKHTEPGDFRQSVYRAVRHGLMRNESILLEPFYDFTLTVPSANAGRAMADIQRMYGSFDEPVTEGEYTVITGRGPVSEMNGYNSEVISYTRGEGRFFAKAGGYEVCHNADEVIEKIGYNPDSDLENPAGSIFCSGGAGFFVPWNEVEEYMHLKGYESRKDESPAEVRRQSVVSDDELDAIFERTYGRKEKKARVQNRKKEDVTANKPYKGIKKKPGVPYLLVDGYNVIFTEDKKPENIEFARLKLIEALKKYQSVSEEKVILVFDGYRVKGNKGSTINDVIEIVYTMEDETADSYIEKQAAILSEKSDVTVATSDYSEQLVIFGSGARRITSAELIKKLEDTEESVRSMISDIKKKEKKHKSVEEAMDKAGKEKKR